MFQEWWRYRLVKGFFCAWSSWMLLFRMATKASTFEDILSLVGDKGRWDMQILVSFASENICLNLQISVTLTRWQYKIFLLTWIEGVLIGFHHLSSVFLGYTPKHWCKLGHFRSNNQHRQVHSEIHPIPTTYSFERSIPFNDASSTVPLSSLKMFFTLTNAQLSPSRPFGTLLVNIKKVQRAGS